VQEAGMEVKEVIFHEEEARSGKLFWAWPIG